MARGDTFARGGNSGFWTDMGELFLLLSKFPRTHEDKSCVGILSLTLKVPSRILFGKEISQVSTSELVSIIGAYVNDRFARLDIS